LPIFKVLVTGANGFVGTALCEALSQRGHTVRRALRGAGAQFQPGADVAVGDLGPATNWNEALRDIEVVIHLAARAHVMRDTAADPLAEYRRINVLATEALAQASCAAGVRRFIFVSSIKVNGEQTADKPFTEHDAARPEDAYGRSKWEAEQVLAKIAAAARLETVILRSPLVYGPGVKGNFLSLMRAVDRGLPLPFAAVRNRRSLLYLGNLVDAIMLCVEHPGAAGQTYLLADDEGVSTPDLARAIGGALEKPARLIALPPALLRAAGAMLGKAGSIARLLGSLQVDSGKIRRELGWQPRSDMGRGLRKTAGWYHRRHSADARH
jgi:nucleoside-diphosphate-sugar epimerase